MSSQGSVVGKQSAKKKLSGISSTPIPPRWLSRVDRKYITHLSLFLTCLATSGFELASPQKDVRSEGHRAYNARAKAARILNVPCAH